MDRWSERPANDAPYRLIHGVTFGVDVVVYSFTNLYGCSIGAGTRIGPFVEIQKGAVVGELCKVQSHAFICEGVTIRDEVFVGHGAIFINDNHPRAMSDEGGLQVQGDWQLEPTVVERGASIGSGAVILGGITVGAKATVGAGSVVTQDVAEGATVAGVPSRALAFETRAECGMPTESSPSRHAQ